MGAASCSGCRDGSGVGFVTGGQMANFTCLAAARHAVLRDAGWDVEADGLQGAPRGPGRRRRAGARDRRASRAGCSASAPDRMRLVATDDQGRMRRRRPARRARRARRADDRLRAGGQGQHRRVRSARARSRRRAAPAARGATSTAPSACGRRRARRGAALLDGVERADSWATDAHKWLNVPYDCGIAVVADAAAHRAAMTSTVRVHPAHADDVPWGFDWTPEFSRRARGVPVYATLRALGRRRRRRARRPLLRARRAPGGSPARRPTASRSSTTSCSTRCSCASRDDDAVTGAVIEARPAGRDVLARRQHLPRPRRDAHLHRRLADDDGRRGAVGRRHPRRRSGRDAGRSEDLDPVAGGRGPQDLGRGRLDDHRPQLARRTPLTADGGFADAG